jgi:uncharacterized protein YjeT (DUF2065 family)
MSYFLCVIGMVLVVEGLPYMTFPEALKRYLLKLAKVSDGSLRVMGGGHRPGPRLFRNKLK